MKKMKQISRLILGLLIIVIFFQSCEKSESRLLTGVDSKQLEFVGIEHNRMLNDVYEFIKNKNISKKTGKMKLESFLIYKINSNTEYSKQSNNIGIDYTKDIFSKKINLNTLLKLTSNKSSNKSSNRLFDGYIDRLDQILTNITDFNDKSVLDAITEIEEEIEQNKNLTEEEMITLLSATQVSRYSYNYWSENWNKWLVLAGEDMSNFNGNSAGRYAIVKADVAGAIGGAAGAWAVNVIPGAGQVAYGGAIIGAGVASSVGAAVYALFGW